MPVLMKNKGVHDIYDLRTIDIHMYDFERDEHVRF